MMIEKELDTNSKTTNWEKQNHKAMLRPQIILISAVSS